MTGIVPVIGLAVAAAACGAAAAPEPSSWVVPSGERSRRRDCHSAAPSLPSVGVSIRMERERQQNDSLANGK